MADPQKTQNGAKPPLEQLWSDAAPGRGVSEPELLIDVEGFEGPLDLLLHLARGQKVDLARISIVALAEQYLVFIERARKQHLELAADYLVMAAWLAFLKSKLLIPKPAADGEPSGEEMAALLQFRLKRLEAMRDAASRLVNRNRVGREIFVRGMPEPVLITKTSNFHATLYDLLTAYAAQRQRRSVTNVQIAKRGVWSLKDARRILARLLGVDAEWTTLEHHLVHYWKNSEERATALASSFAASLELVREGVLEIRQQEAFADIYLRAGPKAERFNMPEDD